MIEQWRVASAERRARRRAALLLAAAAHGKRVGFIVRLIQFLAWLILVTWLGRKLLGWLLGAAARKYAQNAVGGRGSPPSRGGAQLFRDPVCGMHLTEGISVTLERAGTVHHFCSVDCREKFRVMAPPQDSGSKAASA